MTTENLIIGLVLVLCAMAISFLAHLFVSSLFKPGLGGTISSQTYYIITVAIQSVACMFIWLINYNLGWSFANIKILQWVFVALFGSYIFWIAYSRHLKSYRPNKISAFFAGVFDAFAVLIPPFVLFFVQDRFWHPNINDFNEASTQNSIKIDWSEICTALLAAPLLTLTQLVIAELLKRRRSN